MIILISVTNRDQKVAAKIESNQDEPKGKGYKLHLLNLYQHDRDSLFFFIFSTQGCQRTVDSERRAKKSKR